MTSISASLVVAMSELFFLDLKKGTSAPKLKAILAISSESVETIILS